MEFEDISWGVHYISAESK